MWRVTTPAVLQSTGATTISADGRLREKFRERLPVWPVSACRLFGRALEDDAAAAAAALGPEVDDPVGLGDDVEVVLDDHHGVAGVDQPVQHADQLLDVGHVQADGGLVEHVERLDVSDVFASS